MQQVGIIDAAIYFLAELLGDIAFTCRKMALGWLIGVFIALTLGNVIVAAAASCGVMLSTNDIVTAFAICGALRGIFDFGKGSNVHMVLADAVEEDEDDWEPPIE